MRNFIYQFHRKQGTLFFRILFYFLSLLVPIIIIGVITYAYSFNVIRKDFSSKIILNLQSSATTIDIFLQAAQETGIDFFNDYTVNDYFKPYDVLEPEERPEILKISKVISRKKRIAYDFVDNVFAFIDNKRVYSGEGLDDFDDFFEKFYKYEKYDKGFWLGIQAKNRYFVSVK